MTRILRSRPSPAIVVAVLALVAALAGTAIAGPGAGTSAITKSKVKKVANKQIDKRLPWQTTDIADSAVTGPKIADSAVTGPKIADSAVTGPKIASGAVTGAKLGAITVRRLELPLPDGGDAADNVSCPAGEKMIGGGARITGSIANQDYELQSSGPVVNTQDVPEDGSEISAWRIAAHNEAAGGGATTAVVFAICVP